MKKICLVSLILGVIFLSVQTVQAGRPGQLIATTNNSKEELRPPEDPVGTGTLIEINAETGIGSRIAQMEFPGISLAFSQSDGLMYGILSVGDRTDPPSIPKSRLVTINPLDGTTTTLGYIRDTTDNSIHYSVGAMSFAESGELYGITKFYGVYGRPTFLLRIDPKTSLATPIGAGLGTNLFSYGGVIHNGKFYFLTGTQNPEVMVWTVDLVTGVAAPIGSTSVIPNRGGVGVTVGGNGELLAAINDSLYEIDPDIGLATFIGNTGYNLISGLTFIDTIASQCPCNQSTDGTEWGNHGGYVSCVARVVKSLTPMSLENWEYENIMSEAAHSSCGKQ